MYKLAFIVLIPGFLSAGAQNNNNHSFPEDTLKVSVNGGTLEGNLLRPTGSNTLVIIAAGSGPTDRNGNNPMLPGKNNWYKQLADSLAKQGISSFRYDKRGVGKGLFAMKKEQDLRFDDYSQDLLTCADTLQNRFSFKYIFFAGHSEGSLVAMIAATRRKVTGYISMAGTSHSIDKTLEMQLSKIPDSLKLPVSEILEHLRKGETTTKVPSQFLSIFRPSVQPYMISWMKYDPVEVIKQVQAPILITQGTHDIQIPYTEAEDLYKANPKKSTLVIIKNVSHLFKEAPEEPNANFKTYGDPDLPVSPELIQALTTFIKKCKNT